MLFCPRCTDTLHVTERQGIEIDFCPKCRGVWLDHGELEKIIERSTKYEASHQEPHYPPPRYTDHKRQEHYSHHRDDKYYKKKKTKNFIKEIFDIFD